MVLTTDQVGKLAYELGGRAKLAEVESVLDNYTFSEHPDPKVTSDSVSLLKELVAVAPDGITMTNQSEIQNVLNAYAVKRKKADPDSKPNAAADPNVPKNTDGLKDSILTQPDSKERMDSKYEQQKARMNEAKEKFNPPKKFPMAAFANATQVKDPVEAQLRAAWSGAQEPPKIVNALSGIFQLEGELANFLTAIAEGTIANEDVRKMVASGLKNYITAYIANNILKTEGQLMEQVAVNDTPERAIGILNKVREQIAMPRQGVQLSKSKIPSISGMLDKASASVTKIGNKSTALIGNVSAAATKVSDKVSAAATKVSEKASSLKASVTGADKPKDAKPPTATTQTAVPVKPTDSSNLPLAKVVPSAPSLASIQSGPPTGAPPTGAPPTGAPPTTDKPTGVLSQVSSGISSHLNDTNTALNAAGTATYNAIANAPTNISNAAAATRDAAVSAAKATGSAIAASPRALVVGTAAVPYAVAKGLYHTPGAIASTASAASAKMGKASAAVRKSLKESMSQENFNKQAAINQKAFDFINANVPKEKAVSLKQLNLGLIRAQQQLVQAQNSYNDLRERAEDKREFDSSDRAVEANRLVMDAEHNVKDVELAIRNAQNGYAQAGGKRKRAARTYYALEPTRRHKRRRRARTQKGRRTF